MEIAQAPSLKVRKPALVGSIFYVFAFLMHGSIQPYLNVYFKKIGLSGEQIGLLGVIQPILTILFITVISSFADRTSRRVRIAQFAMAGAAITVFLLEFPSTFGGIAALVFCYAVFSSPIMALTDGLISRMAERHNLNFGGIRLWGSFTYAVMSIFFGAVWQKFGYRPMFLTTALLYLPVIFVTGRIEEGPVVATEKRLPMIRLLKDDGLILLLVATFFSGIANSLFLTFGGIFASSLGATSLLIGLMIAFGCFAEVPMMLYNTRITKRIGKVNTVILAYALMAAGYLGYILASRAEMLPIFTIVRGLGYGIWYTVTVRLLIDRTPGEWAATAQSLLGICWFGLAPLIGAPLGGWIHDAISPAAVFILAIISLVLASIILFYASMTKKLV
jgi:MFS transporter, PPP family, 3-phenylpropionic acid transporter